jgi:hypothetical protein
MSDYIVINTYRFRTPQKAWEPSGEVPALIRTTLKGDLDVTYGPRRLKIWDGEIVAPVTPDANPGDGTTWGSIANLRNLLDLRVPITFRDHLGTVYATAALLGIGRERHLLPDWTNAADKVYVTVRIVA